MTGYRIQRLHFSTVAFSCTRIQKVEGVLLLIGQQGGTVDGHFLPDSRSKLRDLD